jgi:hypothetical protein
MFSEAEKGFINTAIERTRRLYIETPLAPGADFSNLNDILVAIHAYHDRVGAIGEEGHAAMFSIYDKLGLCEDGLTTKAERERQLAEARAMEVRNRAKLKNDLVAAYEKQVKHFQEKIKEVQRTDDEIEAEIHDAELLELARVKIAITDLRRKKIADAERDQKKFLESLGVDAKSIPKTQKVNASLAGAKRDPSDIMKGVDLGTLKYNELLALAGELGMKLPPSLKKEDVLAMIDRFVKGA